MPFTVPSSFRNQLALLEQVLSQLEEQLGDASHSSGGRGSAIQINATAGRARHLRGALGIAGCKCSLCTELCVEFGATYPAAWEKSPPAPTTPTTENNARTAPDNGGATGSDNEPDEHDNDDLDEQQQSPNAGAAAGSDNGPDVHDNDDLDDSGDESDNDDDGTQNRGRTICQPADFPVAGFELLIMPSTGNEFGSLVGKWKGAEVTVQGADKKGQGGIAKIRFCSGNSCNRNRSMCNSCRKSYER